MVNVPLGYEFATHIPFLIYLYNMKQNLNEQITRIKNMMGINEEDINLDTYKEDSNIIKNVERVGVSDEGNPIISITLNSFMGQERGNPEGQKVEIKITLEFEKRLGSFGRSFGIKSVKNIVTDHETITGKDLFNNISFKYIFLPHTSVDEMVQNIYKPYFKLHSNDKEYRDKIYTNMSSDEKLIVDVLTGETPKETPMIEPEVSNEPPQEKPSKGNGGWSSTSSW
jgi:hypothetical protein